MRSITVLGRRWFEKTNGNTYHSCIVYIDGKQIAFEPFAYGYGNAYRQTAVELLNKAGITATFPLWRWCKDNNVELVDDVVDVNRKKDL